MITFFLLKTLIVRPVSNSDGYPSSKRNLNLRRVSGLYVKFSTVTGLVNPVMVS